MVEVTNFVAKKGSRELTVGTREEIQEQMYQLLERIFKKVESGWYKYREKAIDVPTGLQFGL